MFARKIKTRLSYIVPALMISPSLIWITLDKSVWPWDQALFGRVSVELFYGLTYTPTAWVNQMLHAIGGKEPGVSWFGQFFVPLGYLLGSIDIGLLLSIWVTQALTLILFYRSVRQLSGQDQLLGVVGSLMIASAPLFVAMSHQYFAEPLQLLAVTWFVMIMSFASSWNRAVILSQLVLATTIAMLAKVSSPLYCLGPGLLALWHVFNPSLSRTFRSEWLQKPVLVVIGLGILIWVATIGWYYTNLHWVIQHASDSSFGPVVKLYWGTKGPFFSVITFWLTAMKESFFLSSVLLMSAVILGVGLIVYAISRNRPTKHFTACGCIAALQLALVLCVFSLSPTKDTRYLLPVLPYVSLLICWGVAQINKPMLASVVILIFSVQLVSTYGQAFGLVQVTSQAWLQLPNRDRKNATVLNSVVVRTCAKTGPRYWNTFGIELPWFNRESAGYYAAKSLAPHNRLGCYYGTVRVFFSDVDAVWNDMLSLNIRYYITMRPDPNPVASDWHSQLVNQNYRPILEKVESSPLFELEPAVIEDPAVLIFHRRESPIGDGRTSDE